MAKKIIILQAGHVAPLQPGHLSETGAAGERELNKEIRDAMAKILASDGRFKVICLPGKIPDGIRCDAYIAFHADGSRTPSASGYTFGYPDYPVNKRLADLIESRYQKIIGHPPRHARDNYTSDEHFYYGFNHVSTPGPEVLWEIGFVSNTRESKWLHENKLGIAQAGYGALLDYFKMTSKTKRYPFVVRIQDKDGSWTVYPSFGGSLAPRLAQLVAGRYKKLYFERKVTVVAA